MTQFEVGDPVRQKDPKSPYQDIINTQVGTIVEVGPEGEVFPVRVFFPDNGFNDLPWPFNPDELELVSIVVEVAKP